MTTAQIHDPGGHMLRIPDNCDFPIGAINLVGLNYTALYRLEQLAAQGTARKISISDQMQATKFGTPPTCASITVLASGITLLCAL